MTTTAARPPVTEAHPRDTRRPGPVLRPWLLVAALVATGLMAGFFFTYHVSVTRGLALVSDPTYVETMTAINATVRNAEFGLAFFGAIPLGIAALATHLARPRGLAPAIVAAGLVLYLATFAITFTLNVPLNEQLAEGARAGVDAAVLRAEYETPWNAANALRTATNLLAFTALAIAAVLTRRVSGRVARGERPATAV